MDLEQIANHFINEARECSSVGYAENCNEKLMEVTAAIAAEKEAERRLQLIKELQEATNNEDLAAIERLNNWIDELEH